MTEKNRSAKPVAIIPARAGSKGIPGKNIFNLNGQPLISYAIQAALKSKSIDRVIVSTDGAAIAKVAKQYGAEVIFRPSKISGDHSKSEDALLHVLSELKTKEDFEPELFVFLQCTSPLTTASDLDGAVSDLKRKKADCSLSVIKVHQFLWRRHSSFRKAGVNHNPSTRPMRQDREPEYLETGNFYVMRTRKFLKAKHRFFGKVDLYEIPKDHALDIDEPADIELGRVFLKRKARKPKK
jgi:N-acylneuraminate cytidylyltransferase